MSPWCPYKRGSTVFSCFSSENSLIINVRQLWWRPLSCMRKLTPFLLFRTKTNYFFLQFFLLKVKVYVVEDMWKYLPEPYRSVLYPTSASGITFSRWRVHLVYHICIFVVSSDRMKLEYPMAIREMTSLYFFLIDFSVIVLKIQLSPSVEQNSTLAQQRRLEFGIFAEL